MKRPRLRGPIPDRLRRTEAPLERDRPRAPSCAEHQRSLDEASQSKDLCPAPRVAGLLLHRQERFGFLEQDVRAAPVPFGPGGEVRDRAVDEGVQILRSPQPVRNAIGQLIPRLAAHDQTAADQGRQRRFDIRDIGDVRDVLNLVAPSSRPRHHSAPLFSRRAAP